MVSFSELWSHMDEQKSPLMGNDIDDNVMNAIKTGLHLRNKEDVTFWRDFITMCSSDGFAELVGVPREKLATWPGKIEEYLDKVENEKVKSPHHQDDTKVLPTGDNGALNSSNMDPIDNA